MAKKDEENRWTVYILRCADGTLYTGLTNDIQKRLASHNDGTGAKYTAFRRPVELEYSESHASRSEASKREFQIKNLTRVEKEELIERGFE